ncbi:hypothetical protein WMF37_40915 [Sorangium sp. So ce291]|uniref:hypothetical protein n=1 Tax=Sorangium sp. So ce291 TaxID=3133294 RepID=UPI003F5F4CAB
MRSGALATARMTAVPQVPAGQHERNHSCVIRGDFLSRYELSSFGAPCRNITRGNSDLPSHRFGTQTR